MNVQRAANQSDNESIAVHVPEDDVDSVREALEKSGQYVYHQNETVYLGFVILE